ncbi:MAG TPA: hypothetical protein VF928_06245 [Usitatibacteraceae bacterium]
MKLTILAADLIPPEAFISRRDLPAMPGLQTLLAQSTLARSGGRFLEEACLGELGLKVIYTNPIAPLTLLADGGEPGEDTWLRADPVHLHISRDNVQLMDSHVIEPTLEEAVAIAATLNAHLANDGLKIEVRDAARWYLRVPTDEMPETTPLWKVSGGSVFEHLPQHGGGKINWRGLQNELQMLLNDHPVNTARESRGELPINGIWFWGAGSFAALRSNIKPANPARMLGVQNSRNEIRPPRLTPPPKNPNRHELVVAKLALARGLAMKAKLPLNNLPSGYSGLPFSELNTLVVLHSATRALRANQRHDWMLAVEAMDRDWFAPVQAAFARKTITGLTLLLPNEAATLRATIERPPQWKVWKRFKSTAKPLADYLHG